MKYKLVNTNYRSNWVDNILLERGISEEDLNAFYDPTINNLQDPSNLDNCEAAADVILKALTANKKIGIIIDSDMDGVASATILYHYLHDIYPNCHIIYTYHQHKNHGLEDCCDFFINNQVDLVIETDAGINDCEYHDQLGEAGIFTICADHHIYEDKGFSKFAIYVDNQISNNYINKSLAGCGVTWQLCRMMDKLNHTDYAFKYIDLVALGCAADVMSPLTLENRYIFDYGFAHVQDPTFLGIIEKQSYSMKGIVDYTSVAFYVSPLINACMRTGTSEEKELMYSMFLNPNQIVISNKRGAVGTKVGIIEECLRILTNVKSRQQKLIEKYVEVFEDRIAAEGLNDNNILLFRLRDEDTFSPELNGLIATKFSAKYHKPCLVVRDGDDDETKGSQRNPNGSPISGLKSVLNECPYITFTAGHENSSGVGIKTSCVDKFIDWFNNYTKEMNFNENSYEVNFDLRPTDTYLEALCYDVAEHNNLWGGNNPQPIIGMNGIHLTGKEFTIMGAKNNTIKFSINGVSCVIFNCSDLVNQIKTNKNYNISFVGRPVLNLWMGRTSVQLLVDEIDVKEDNLLEF